MYFPYLDSIRGIAILLVLLVHSPVFYPIAKQGELGVLLFFALSGFLLSYISCGQIYKNGYSSFKLFWIKRIRRLLPAILALILLLSFISVFYSEARSDLWPIITFQSNFMLYLNSTLSFAGHTWSLSAEIQYYILFSLTLLGVNQLNLNSKLKKITLLLLIQSAYFICFFSLSVFLFYFYPSLSENYKFCPPTSLFQLSLGSIAGSIFFISNKLESGIYKNLEIIKNVLSEPILFSFNLAAILIISMFCSYPIASNPWTAMTFSIFSSALIFQGASQERIHGIAGFILKNHFLSLLGKISYSLYLYHYTVNLFHREIFTDSGIQGLILGLRKESLVLYHFFNLSQYVAEILVAILISYLSFNLFERHFTQSTKVNLIGK